MTAPLTPSGLTGRRTFIKTAAVAGVTLAGWRPTLGRGRALAKLNVASIGVGGMGASDLAQISSHPEVFMVGLCDIDGKNLRSASLKHKDAETFSDYRELFDKLGDRVDAVSITIPDHMHAAVAMMAMNKDKHVYVQKPLAWSVHENRALAAAAAAKPHLATQMGTQNASREMKQRCMRFVREGNLGKIKSVHGSTDRPIWPQGNPRPQGSDPVPSNVNWDVWLGVAPVRPFKNGAYHAFNWRGVRDFGCGALGDMACHSLDTAFQPLELRDPISVICESSDGTDDQFPSKEVVTMVLPGNKFTGGEPIEFTWHDGRTKPSNSSLGLPPEFDLPFNTVVIVGENGTLLVPEGGDGWTLFRDGKKQEFEMPEARGGNHWHLWVDHARGSDFKSLTPLQYGGAVSETLALGALASRFPGEKLEWDAAAMKFTNKPEANQYLTRTYRDGFQVAGL
jgi:predicted dehydrogenase